MKTGKPSDSILDVGRRELGRQAGCRLVECDEYCRLLIGTKRLRRCDDTAQGVRGLLDLDTGVRFVIAEERLFRVRTSTG
jgi:hypothetical protein